MTLLEAEDTIDTGPIWHKISISVPVGALCNEINKSLFDAEIELLDYAVENFHRTKPRPQDAGVKPSYFVRRTPSDSRIDPEKSISSQFNLLRVCDENRYPAFFELNGRKYIIRLEKGDD
jgi:methionyl-tRNA formyltransferase